MAVRESERERARRRRARERERDGWIERGESERAREEEDAALEPGTVHRCLSSPDISYPAQTNDLLRRRRRRRGGSFHGASERRREIKEGRLSEN